MAPAARPPALRLLRACVDTLLLLGEPGAPAGPADACAAPAGVLTHEDVEHHWLAGAARTHTHPPPRPPRPPLADRRAPGHSWPWPDAETPPCPRAARAPALSPPQPPLRPPNPAPHATMQTRPSAGTPRADLVPSRERPEGHYATPRGRTPLQQHLDYFDL
ncbi:hypothetical protein MNEG_13585 [Monoraphidium neglectum]|uniref:Uncharacterized protein n=1 Tax=Monoraphidium neglectum TaxID=145388 RepID=A0A0D2KET7_9CHLO|nr:hypothetical protein MNEG_13585 [Monoraphidium neglectum]KIY94378.1 hypothetical protein MNEG_13585 [Monoraphidium neglectum]|eukprot:XP_013893398.1 hypothetical protein MNEG_13585 [Monoraphidium neglectum]